MEIDVKLIFETPVNVGSGVQVSTFADRPMIKDAWGWPYIPASTLKGRLRHTLEQLISGLGEWVCRPPKSDTMCKTDPCAVCQLMGSSWIPSRLAFENLELSGPPPIVQAQRETAYPRTQMRPGVALERRRKVAADRLLYDTEIFHPGIELEFSGKITGAISRQQAALVIAGLRSVQAIGGSKSSGLGWCRVEATVRCKTCDGWQALDDAELREELAAWH